MYLLGMGRPRVHLAHVKFRHLVHSPNQFMQKKSVTIRARGHFTEARSHRQVGI